MVPLIVSASAAKQNISSAAHICWGGVHVADLKICIFDGVLVTSCAAYVLFASLHVTFIRCCRWWEVFANQFVG